LNQDTRPLFWRPEENTNRRLDDIKAIAFDLDGTLYYNKTVIPGAIELVKYLQRKGHQIFYFTNSSVKSRASIYEKLIGMGFKLSIEQVYASSHSAAIYLKKEDINYVYCVGSNDLCEELTRSGINISEDVNTVQAVLIGLDVDFSYSTISKVMGILSKKKARLIACNKDKSFPIEGNKLMPGCGPIVAAIEVSCNIVSDFIVGKPNTFMMTLLSEDWGFNNKEILVIGDSYSSDIEMAKRFGAPSVLISHGIGINKYQDTLVVNGIKDVKYLFD
jgi:HAD superfamily hydrolase (TIGR01450 family)